MTTTATRSLTTTVVRCQEDACHSHGLPGFLFAINEAKTAIQMKCPRCGSSQVIALDTLKVIH